LFQPRDEDPDVQPLLPEPWGHERDQLLNNQEAAKAKLCDILERLESVFLIIDGLDEIENEEWREDLLTTILDILQRTCHTTKLLISTRELPDISFRLKKLEEDGHLATIRVNEGNLADIRAYVCAETDALLSKIERANPPQSVLMGMRQALESIADRSKGNYASGPENLMILSLTLERHVPLREAPLHISQELQDSGRHSGSGGESSKRAQ
jgi:hypothetical protein